MILVKHPNEWLEKTVADFDFSKLDAEKIESEMIELMKAEKGMGLAANQVALDAKIFVMQPYNTPGRT
jgi:peptide deformylase